MVEEIDVLLREKRIFEPSQELVLNSNIFRWMKERGIESYDELLERAQDIERFWGEVAGELDWYKNWDRVLVKNHPFYQWFVGGKINVAYNALDRHLKKGLENKVAYYWEGDDGKRRKVTYGKLSREVNKLAEGLTRLGIKKGDTVGIYLPMIPELPASMLACAKIGAIHNVVFSGFSPQALRERLENTRTKVVITADGGFRRGKVVETKKNVDEAINGLSFVKKVVIVRRTHKKITLNRVRDIYYDELLEGLKGEVITEILDSEDPLYILYTSGTTGKPKGIIHVHGGYAVQTALSLKWVFDIKEEDIWWCAADIGWVTGHSYIVYAPLILGTTSILFEGAPDYPTPSRWWKIIDRYKVTILYTSPTAVRMHIKFGEKWAKKHDLSSLRLLGSVGEPINPEAWLWYYTYVGREKCPIMDTWWQTETGSFLISPVPIIPLKPGSAAKPLPGIDADVVDGKGKSLRESGKGGYVVIKKPWPAMARTLYKDPKRYREVYWSRFSGFYFTGDAARVDKDGYFWFQGRVDDVLNVSGHRIGTAEVESALVEHKKVAEAAVVGVPHSIKGEAIKAFVVLKEGFSPSDELAEELKGWVAKKISPIARPEEIKFVELLPKTRSGKIMRRLLKAKELGKPLGDISTLEE